MPKNDDFIEKVKQNIKKNLPLDEKTHKQKQKEKKLKKKRQFKELKGDYDENNGV